jgi:pimeloyl-ACP methyl ester carboxylesterase
MPTHYWEFILKKILLALALLIIVGIVIYLLGSRVPQDHTITFDPASIDNNIDGYIEQQEAHFDDIIDGAEKTIVWRNPETKAKSRYSIVYLHGFSATKEETRPLTDILADELDANIFYTRFKGHGRKDANGFGAALATASANDWLNETYEAIEIGRRIGERVIVIGTSTGATFATWAAIQPSLVKDVEGMILISANYGVQAGGAALLTKPWGAQLANLIAGDTYSFEASSEDHAKYWTTHYPTKSVLPMAASVEMALSIPHKKIEVPALFIYSPNDKVVDIKQLKTVARRWGADVENPADTLEILDSDDPNSHVIAGDILSPSTTENIAGDVAGWIGSLR